MGFDPGIMETDLKKVFRSGQKFVLVLDDSSYMEIFMKVPSEEDINNARTYSLRESAKYRRSIYEDNDLIEMLLPSDIDKMSKEDIIGNIVSKNIKLLSEKARSNVSRRIKFPKQPGTYSTLEDMEKYQREVDEWPRRFAEELEKELNKLIDIEKRRLDKIDREKLIDMLEKSIIDEYVSIFNLQRFLDYILYRIVYVDNKRMFESPEEVRNIPINIRSQLIDFYYDISLDTGYLKK